MLNSHILAFRAELCGRAREILFPSLLNQPFSRQIITRSPGQEEAEVVQPVYRTMSMYGCLRTVCMGAAPNA